MPLNKETKSNQTKQNVSSATQIENFGFKKYRISFYLTRKIHSLSNITDVICKRNFPPQPGEDYSSATASLPVSPANGVFRYKLGEYYWIWTHIFF